MVDRQERILNSRRSRMAKKVTFQSWWQPFDHFCFEILSIFSYVPIFSFCYSKKCVCVCTRALVCVCGGGRAWPPSLLELTALFFSYPFSFILSNYKYARMKNFKSRAQFPSGCENKGVSGICISVIFNSTSLQIIEGTGWGSKFMVIFKFEYLSFNTNRNFFH